MSEEMRLIDANELYDGLKEDFDRLNKFAANNRRELAILCNFLDRIEAAKTIEWRKKPPKPSFAMVSHRKEVKNREMPGENR